MGAARAVSAGPFAVIWRIFVPVVYSVCAVLAAYLLGSLSFAVIVTRVMGLNDPRTYGSKNPGATNVLRSGSKAAAVVTLLLDAVRVGCPWCWCAGLASPTAWVRAPWP